MSEADRDLSVVLDALARGGAKGFSLAVRTVHRTLEVVCIAAAATGVVAFALGEWAWHRSLPGAVLALLVGATTVGVAVYVLVRIRALARAMRRPGDAVAQAQDLAMRAKGSPELHQLARQVAAGRGAAKRAGLGRTRRALRTGRLISTVIGLASPDPVQHDLLVPFTPARLKALWLAIGVGLWTWLVAAVMASLALLSLAIQSL